MQNTRICFIGAGNMGRSLIGGLIANAYPAELLSAADPDASQRQQLASLFNVSVYENNEQALAGAEVVVLAVKPQAMRATLRGMLDGIQRAQALVVSIAAGIRLSAISAIIGEDMPIIRVMPNTPSLIQPDSCPYRAHDGLGKLTLLILDLLIGKQRCSSGLD